jgi:CO dehydrogenase maturation factor
MHANRYLTPGESGLVSRPARNAVAVLRQYREYSLRGRLVRDRRQGHRPGRCRIPRPRDRRRTVGLPYVFAVVRAMEQGNRFEVENLEPANRQTLNRILDTVEAAVHDPPPFLAFPRKP